MEIITKDINGHSIAVISSDVPVLTDEQAALDLLATVQYQANAYAMVIPKEAVAEAFFDLSTQLAGNVLQKIVNYSTKIAIVGDFSGYTSKSLADFIRESNRGKDIFFVATQDEALQKLARAMTPAG